MARKSLRELKAIVKKDIAYNQDMADSFKNNNNPQVKELYHKALSRIEAMEAVLQYCKTGEKFFFDKELQA